MRIKLLIFLLIILYSCGNRSTKETSNLGSAIKIDLLSEPRSTVKKLSDFAVNVEYVPLQTTENSMIGEFVLKIVNVDKRIYIQNSGIKSEILCFDIDGKFLYKIEKKGRGPEEYISVEDFDISSDNKLIAILSFGRLLFYGISDTGFVFHRSINLKDPSPVRVNLIPGTNKAFLAIAPWRGTEPTLSLLINTVGDTMHFKPNSYQYKMVRKENFRALNEVLVYSAMNAVCFREEFSDTVFYVDAEDNSFKPRIIIDSHGTLTTPEMRGGSEKGDKDNNFIANLFETSRYVFYYYGTTEKRDRIIFDKKTKTKYKLDSDFFTETIAGIERQSEKTKLKDDLGGGPDFNVEFMRFYCSGDKLFSFINAMTVKKYVAGENFKDAQVRGPKKKEELIKLADSLNETDNPLLIIVTPKE